MTLSNFFYITLLKISDQETVKKFDSKARKSIGAGANIDLRPGTPHNHVCVANGLEYKIDIEEEVGLG